MFPIRVARVVALALLAHAGAASAAVVVHVPGTSNPYLAGMPAGATASLTDSAPGESPVEATGLAVFGGATFTFSATGAVANDPNYPRKGPDGGAMRRHRVGAQNGFADVTMPINALLGVFLTDEQPGGSAPGALDFSTGASRDFTTLAPGLYQPFFIGDGQTSGGVMQSFTAPEGATRLFLGVMDGYEWTNNVGAFEVVVDGPEVATMPIPATLPLLAGALGAVALHVRTGRRKPR